MASAIVLFACGAFLALGQIPRIPVVLNAEHSEALPSPAGNDIGQPLKQLDESSAATRLEARVEQLSASPDRWLVRFVSEAEEPIIGLDVLVQSADDYEFTKTDGNGIASVGIQPPWRILTHETGYSPTRLDVSELDDRLIHTIVMDRNTTFVGGQCWVGRTLASKPIQLRLMPDSGTLFASGALSPLEREFLGIDPQEPEALRIETNSAGSFLLRGRGIGSIGTIYASEFLALPFGTVLESVKGYLSKGVRYSAPENGLELQLWSNSNLCGRCILAGSGVPLEGVTVTATINSTAESWTYASGVTNPEGEFCLMSPTQFPHKVSLIIGGTSRSAGANVTMLAADAQFPHLGTIQLNPQTLLSIRVVDSLGMAVGGAVVKVGDSETRCGSDGRTRLPTSALCQEMSVHVSAPGYSEFDGWIPAHSTSEQDIVIDALNRLTVYLKQRSGAPMAAFGLRGPADLFGATAKGMEGSPVSRDDESGVVSAWAGPDGAVLLGGLPLGRPLEMQVIDPFGQTVRSIVVEPFNSTERRELVVECDVSPKSFSVSVSDENGSALPGVEIEIASVGGSELGHTNAAGRYEVRDYCGDTVRIVAGGPAWSDVTVASSAVVDGQSFEIVLIPSVSLLVTAGIAVGVLPDELEIMAMAPDGSWSQRGIRVSNETWVFHDVPMGRTRLQADSKVWEGSVDVDTRVVRSIQLDLVPRQQ